MWPRARRCDFLTHWPTLARRATGAGQRPSGGSIARTTVARPTSSRRGSQRSPAPRRSPRTPPSSGRSAWRCEPPRRSCARVLEAIQVFDARIAEVFAAHDDHDLFTSFPGAGAVMAPRLAAAFGTDRSRWDSAAELQAHSGIAPVTERSGKTLVGPSPAGLPEICEANLSRIRGSVDPVSTWARAYYDQQRARGNEHHAALRALAYKWIRILFPIPPTPTWAAISYGPRRVPGAKGTAIRWNYMGMPHMEWIGNEKRLRLRRVGRDMLVGQAR